MTDSTNRAGLTALHLAAWAGNSILIERLLEAGASPGLRDANGQTPLEVAVARDQAPAAGVLMKAGGVALPAGMGPSQPIHLAITGNDAPRFCALLAAKTGLDAPDELGLRPLHLAVRRGHLPFLVALLRAGADGRTAWDLARPPDWGDLISRTGKSRLTGPYPLLDTDPFYRRSGARLQQLLTGTLATIESLGGVPGQGRATRAGP